MNLKALNGLLCCPIPSCRRPLPVDEGDVTCPGCGIRYPRRGDTLDLTPPRAAQELRRWQTWETLQHNGLVSYTQAPQGNLGVGERPDCLAFSRFCDLRGLVLDIGCGPQSWPAYFAQHQPDTRFVGIDPLAPDEQADYPRVRGLGEFLPFADRVFDRVLLATSLDHMLDPAAVLAEARRVSASHGQVLVWSGEKKPGAPRPAQSPPWYQELVVPQGAEDPFHFKRFTEDEVLSLLRAGGLRVHECRTMPVDEWRANHFYRCKAA